MPLISRPRGTTDLMPSDRPAWRAVATAFTRLAERHGYQRIDVPTFENVELFERGVGEETDAVSKEMYVFEDRGGRKLALRPEFTASIVRAYLERGPSNWVLPVRVFLIGPAFRYDRPQSGRSREFWQLDLEVLGDPGPRVDVEVVGIAWALMVELGLQRPVLQLNCIGDAACRPIWREALRRHFLDHSEELAEVDVRRADTNPLRVLDSKEERSQRAIASAPQVGDYLCEDCRAHFAGVRQGLERLGVPYELNPRLVRGLDYYTRTTFEIWHPALGASQNSVGGGGRYDGLVEALGGPPTPGIGFAIGIERLITAMESEGTKPPPQAEVDVVIAPLGEEDQDAAWDLAERWRAAGKRVLVDYSDRGLKAKVRAADHRGARVLAVMGPEEREAGEVSLRWLEQGAQERVKTHDALAALERGPGGG